MSTATPKDVVEALADLATTRAMQKKRCAEANAEAQELLEKHGCKTVADLKQLNASQCASFIDELHAHIGKPQRLAPLYERIAVCIRALPDGGCPVDYKDAVYRAMAATEDLEPTQEDELLNALKPKLPGKPTIASIRKEYETRKREAHARKGAPLGKDVKMILFFHHEQGKAYGGLYDRTTDKFLPNFRLAPLSPEGRENLCGQMGLPPIEVGRIPGGIFEFHPGSEPQVSERTDGSYRINTWTPPPLRALAVPSTTIPETIRRLLLHVLGAQSPPTDDDLKMLDHFVNWLAVIFHTHDRTDTAWIITGRTLTGKGTLIKEIVTPLFGHVKSKEMRHLEGEFNEFLADTQILIIDEATSDRFKGAKVQAALRRIITEDPLTITEKFEPQREIRNCLNVILTSNEHTPIKVPPDERRYNIPPRQEKPFPGSRDELQTVLRAEMPAFVGYIAQYRYDKERAQSVIMTAQREEMIDDSATTSEQFARAIKGEGSTPQCYDGDLDFFLDGFWDNVNGQLDHFSPHMLTAKSARRVLLEWAQSANPADATRRHSLVVPPAHVAALYNFFMQDKYELRPRQIGKLLHLKAIVNFGEQRGKGYRLCWRTKQTAAELAATVKELERFDEADRDAFAAPEPEPEAPKPKASETRITPPTLAPTPAAAPTAAAPQQPTSEDLHAFDGPTPAPPAKANGANGVDASWKFGADRKRIPLTTRKLSPCPPDKVEALRAALKHFDVDTLHLAPGRNGYMLFTAEGMPADDTAYKALLSKVYAHVR